MDTRFKKGDIRLIGNKFALGSKPNQTSFKKGGHPSPETEFKKGEMSEKMKGEKNPSWRGGKPICIDCGNKLKKNIGKRCKKCHNKIIKGEGHWNWQGGKSFELYGQEFKPLREQIRKRDNYQCQECGFFQKDSDYALSVHHIDYNKKNNNPNNLISLCMSCHLQTNYKREDWTEYFKQKLYAEIK